MIIIAKIINVLRDENEISIITSYIDTIEAGDKITIINKHGTSITSIKILDIKLFTSTNRLCIKIDNSDKYLTSQKFIDIGSRIVNIDRSMKGDEQYASMDSLLLGFANNET